MQKQRFELKYLINEDIALTVRDYVRCYLNMDEYSVGRPNYSYPVHSLYLDSDDLKTYWATINGDKNRFKLRLRYYSTNPDAPVFFEIKKRVNNCIMKQRGGVKQAAVDQLLKGYLPEQDHLLSKNPSGLVALQRFCYLMGLIHAKPKVHVGYLREAYVSDNDQVRVTVDREVCSEPNLSTSIKTHMDAPVRSFAGFVILELKFTNRFPNWFGDLVRQFHTMQCGAAKYVEGIQGIGSKPLECPFAVIDDPTRLARVAG